MKRFFSLIIFIMAAAVGHGQNDSLAMPEMTKDTVPADTVSAKEVITDTVPARISPYLFGLATAESDTDRYWALYNTHKTAMDLGAEVSYDSIEELSIAIPKDAKSIPLGNSTDFGHLVLKVTNTSKNFYLFQMSQPTDTLEVDKALIDSGDFSGIAEISQGAYLLLLQDDSLWVDKRQGHSYGHTRKDVLYVENGIAQNKPIMPYNTPETKLRVRYCRATPQPKVIRGITIQRQKESTSKTYCFDVKNEYNVVLEDVEITTPNSEFYADAAIRINDCARVLLDSVRIFGTYSQSNHYGYGISMDNVWKSEIRHLKAKAKWGIFGNNNINEALLDSCDLNRYDVHCYGRQVVMRNCKFNNLYNQFSSMYDSIIYENCLFDRHVPVLLESTYNAYTPFELVFRNCVFNVSSSRNYIVDVRDLSDIRNSRPEVAKKCLPNIAIYQSTFKLVEPVQKVYMFHCSAVSYTDYVEYVDRIDIKGLKVRGGAIMLKISNKDFPHEKKFDFPLYNHIIGE